MNTVSNNTEPAEADDQLYVLLYSGDSRWDDPAREATREEVAFLLAADRPEIQDPQFGRLVPSEGNEDFWNERHAYRRHQVAGSAPTAPANAGGDTTSEAGALLPCGCPVDVVEEGHQEGCAVAAEDDRRAGGTVALAVAAVWLDEHTPVTWDLIGDDDEDLALALNIGQLRIECSDIATWNYLARKLGEGMAAYVRELTRVEQRAARIADVLDGGRA